MNTRVWKVKYVHLQDAAERRPFFKRTSYAEGNSRAESIQRVRDYVGSSYARFSASPAPEGHKADSFFQIAYQVFGGQLQ